jgi:hypothetical protein
LPHYHQVISFVSEDSTYNTIYVNRIMNILAPKYIKPCSIIYKLFKSMRGGLDILFFWRTVCLAFFLSKIKISMLFFLTLHVRLIVARVGITLFDNLLLYLYCHTHKCLYLMYYYYNSLQVCLKYTTKHTYKQYDNKHAMYSVI